jgi:predicted outer membrane repeat protein
MIRASDHGRRSRKALLAGPIAGGTFVVLAAVAPSVPAGAVASVILKVCPKGCQYDQIQPAVDVAAPGDTIAVGPGTYTGGIVIAKSLTVLGSGAAGTVITGGGPVITVSGGQVVIRRVTVSGGDSAADGGGILNTGALTLTRTTVMGNSAAGSGGGILNTGTVTLTRTTVMGNSAADSGGGLANSGMTARAQVSGTKFLANTAALDGGGIENRDSAHLTLRSDAISKNSASAGGGIEVAAAASATARYVTVSRNTSDLGGAINVLGASLRVRGSAICDNDAMESGFGGGIEIAGFRHGPSAVVAIMGSIVTGNSAGTGGGVDVESNSRTTFVHDIVSRNTASTDGGGIATDSAQSATLRLVNTSVIGNTSEGDGGGIYNSGVAPGGIAVIMKLTDGKVNANFAARDGGGIYNDSGGSAAFDNNTSVSRNKAHAGGGVYMAGGKVALNGATVHANSPDNCEPTAC